jgi:hypothetical protein
MCGGWWVAYGWCSAAGSMLVGWVHLLHGSMAIAAEINPPLHIRVAMQVRVTLLGHTQVSYFHKRAKVGGHWSTCPRRW